MQELETERLCLEPIREHHASEMVTVLKAESLYDFIPSNPPTIEELISRYKMWEKNLAPDGSEIWLNWAARLKESGKLVGHFQSGIKVDSTESYIAYTVGAAFQRRGYSYEALKCLCTYLREQQNVKTIKAWIDTRNMASISLVSKLGMRQVAFVKDADRFKGNASDEYVFEF